LRKAAPSGFFQEGGGLLLFDESFGRRPLCGLDEAGRGPLAGPLAAAACVLDPNVDYTGVNDSKSLSPEKREELLRFLARHSLAFSVALISPAEVDRLNPLRASMEGMRRAFLRLKVAPVLALADGDKAPALPCETIAVVKGDQKSLSIAAASILAKAVRDRVMLRLHKKHPDYGFDRHKGYPTRAHYEALARFGPSPVHRLSFRGVAQAPEDGPEGGPGGLFG
jgi:ribonuclease HII